MTTGTQRLVLIIWNLAPVMLLYSINTQSFNHDKSSSASQFINVKSTNLQKLLRYLSRILTSTFKVGTAGCGGHCVWVPSGFCGSHGCRSGLFGVFPTIFVLYLNDLPSEALS